MPGRISDRPDRAMLSVTGDVRHVARVLLLLIRLRLWEGEPLETGGRAGAKEAIMYIGGGALLLILIILLLIWIL